MGTFAKKSTAAVGSTIAAPSKVSLSVKGKRVLGVMLEIPPGNQGAAYVTGFAIWIGNYQLLPTEGDWVYLDNFHTYVPMPYVLKAYENDAVIRAYTTDAVDAHSQYIVVITED